MSDGLYYNKLQRFYSRNGVKFRTARPAYRGEIFHHDRILTDKFHFCLEVLPLLRSNYPVLWADETSINAWLQPKKVFMDMREPFRVPLPSKRHSQITLFGAVGNCLARSCFYIGKKTTINEFSNFAASLKDCLLPLTVRPVLILDNHRAHKNPQLLRSLEQDFLIMFQPAYSPQLNSQEWMWAMVKPAIRRRLLELSIAGEFERDDMLRVVTETLAGVSVQVSRNVGKCCVPNIKL